MRTRRLTGFTLTILWALDVSAQATPAGVAEAPPQSTAPASSAAPPAAEADLQLRVGASTEAGASADVSGIDTVDDPGESASPEVVGARTGFETGLRVGIGLPMGSAGRDLFGSDRDLNDLTTWRAPFWFDVGYRMSDVTTLGAYVQLGLGGNGDACIGDCDWSDIRVGAQAQWRLAPGAPINPWLGVGVGYEWLSFRQLVIVPVANPDPEGPQEVDVRFAEQLGGPELLLQGGLDFVVEDSLSIGPFASATLGQYLGDGFKCQPNIPDCPGGSEIEGSGFHSSIGIGLRGSYVP